MKDSTIWRLRISIGEKWGRGEEKEREDNFDYKRQQEIGVW
jgi:hypothetical protein